MDGGLLNSVVNQFTTDIANTWGPLLTLYMVRVLGLVVAAQCIFMIIDVAWSRDLSRIVDDLALGFLRIAACYFLFNHTTDLGTGLIALGQDIGQTVSGQSPLTLTPSGILNAGLGLAAIMWHAKGSGGWINDIVQSIEVFILSLVMVTCWLGAALIYALLLIEATALAYAGPLFTAFTPLVWTFDLGVGWAKQMLAAAIEIATLLMVLAVILTIVGDWTHALAAGQANILTNMWNMVEPAAASIIAIGLVMSVPVSFRLLGGGSPMLNYGRMASSMIATGVASLAASAPGAAAEAGSQAAMQLDESTHHKTLLT